MRSPWVRLASMKVPGVRLRRGRGAKQGYPRSEVGLAERRKARAIENARVAQAERDRYRDLARKATGHVRQALLDAAR